MPGCNFDFETTYGSVGSRFAHVHHLRPLSQTTAPMVTTLKDLAVVCANCHAIVHRGGECRPLSSLIS
ncbi:HNH endonuclease [uncultured Thiodictyon sp.]|uniref:HNH endonuclease n=1 Tax=uncultured Thiodictyon sp. TaxID=1846217 RepID=UPI0034454435